MVLFCNKNCCTESFPPSLELDSETPANSVRPNALLYSESHLVGEPWCFARGKCLTAQGADAQRTARGSTTVPRFCPGNYFVKYSDWRDKHWCMTRPRSELCPGAWEGWPDSEDSGNKVHTGQKWADTKPAFSTVAASKFSLC